HVRPTVFLDNPMFSMLARRSVHDRGVLPLPFGSGHTSPIPADDVARVIVAVLLNPTDRIGHVYELTGPEVLDINGMAEQYARALKRPVTAEDTPYDEWNQLYLRASGLPEHVQQHIATMARLHHEDRYNRATDDVAKVTGEPAQTVEQYVSAHPERFGGASAGSSDTSS
ncbi:MAG: hydroxylase, partial [Mycobacteriaceae bacterium]|nr:hydroxylase [Mycobacteriaceae bacterium]